MYDYKAIKTVFDKCKSHQFITGLGLISPKT